MRLRAPVFDDAPAVLAVLVARDLADLGVPDITLEDLLDEWGGSDLDLAADARVAEAGDGRHRRVRRRPSTGNAGRRPPRPRGPGHRNAPAGVGGGSRPRPGPRAPPAVDGGRERERADAADRRRLLGGPQLLADGVLARGRAALPCRRRQASMLRAVDVARDAVALHAVDAASFGGRPDYVAETLREFREEHLEAHDFDAALSRVAERDGAIVGFLLARRFVDDAVGYVDILAVDPRHQGRGVGTALLGERVRGVRRRRAPRGAARRRLRQPSGAAGLRARGDDGPVPVRHLRAAGGVSDLRGREPPPSRWRSYRDVDAAGDPGSLGDQLDHIARGSVPRRREAALARAARAGSRRQRARRRVRHRVRARPAGRDRRFGRPGRRTRPQHGLARSGASSAGWKHGSDRARPAAMRPRCRSTMPSSTPAAPTARSSMSRDRRRRWRRWFVSRDRPGAVVVTESRWGLVAPDLDQRLTDAVLALTRPAPSRRAGSGAGLPAMFERAGLTGVRSVTSDHTVGDHDEFFRFTHLDRSAEDAARAGALTPEEATAWLERLSDLLRRGEAFAMVLVAARRRRQARRDALLSCRRCGGTSSRSRRPTARGCRRRTRRTSRTS